VKSFSRGLDNLAVANNSWESLYRPTVVMYVVGFVINESYRIAPVDEEINDGLVE
jgi:hypothetical protein